MHRAHPEPTRLFVLTPHRIAAAAALAALHLGALAQQAAESGKLAPVNVTAERRTENLSDGAPGISKHAVHMRKLLSPAWLPPWQHP